MTSIRPFDDEERNRAKERAMANMHDPFGNFPKKSLEARVEAIEEFKALVGADGDIEVIDIEEMEDES